MQLSTRNMIEEMAREIISWKYIQPYDFYNMKLSNGAVQEMLAHTYYAVVDRQNKLMGFFCMGSAAQVPAGNQYDAYQADAVDIGFGMKPELTGKGNGFKFLLHILAFVHKKFPETNIRLSVATFNKRAIHLYEKFGFVETIAFQTDTANFITMVKEMD